MQVVRVLVHADVTSFRHPFFVTGRQPTFDIPPPSTIHGHCASALGRWPDPSSFFFGLHFSYRSRGQDLEHQHIAKVRGATSEITIQPVPRDFLFDVNMTLYLPADIGIAFRSPTYTVVLGRSQDLGQVVSVDEIDLERPSRARVEHTILPWSIRPCLSFGSTVLLTKYISEPPERHATFERYVVLHEPVFYGEGADPNRSFLRVENISFDDLWIDPTIVDDDGFSRGVWIHRIAGEKTGSV
jgi:CRISPR-associated protein Cas5t